MCSYIVLKFAATLLGHNTCCHFNGINAFIGIHEELYRIDVAYENCQGGEFISMELADSQFGAHLKVSLVNTIRLKTFSTSLTLNNRHSLSGDLEEGLNMSSFRMAHKTRPVGYNSVICILASNVFRRERN
jgi:hypothetical protein